MSINTLELMHLCFLAHIVEVRFGFYIILFQISSPLNMSFFEMPMPQTVFICSITSL
jgi:hypothetical protein